MANQLTVYTVVMITQKRDDQTNMISHQQVAGNIMF